MFESQNKEGWRKKSC